VQKKETTTKKAKIKLLDLTPKKNPQGGGGFSYFRKPSFPIPPPGFISSSGNGAPDSRR